jgi:hypothetical protein
MPKTDTGVGRTGSTDVSLSHYAKGLLYLLEQAPQNPEAAHDALNYFLRTNPWRVQESDGQKLVDPALRPEQILEDDEDDDEE